MSKKDWSLDAWLRAGAHGLAHAQHLGDKIIEWGFSKMNQAGEEEPIAKKDAYTGRAETAGRRVLKTLGSAGKAYYERYEELKKQK